ncbi:MAG: TraB/GumN family protein [Ruminococcus sp.]|nr:TraB/GumN family protein [Ruminococcus sp.]
MKAFKAICISLAAAMSVSVVSCGSSESSSKSSSSSETITESAETTTEETDDAEENTTEEKETEDSTEAGSSEEKSEDINDYITVDEPTPALWKATDPETGNELYMLGTIHVVSEEKFKMPDYLMDVYNDSEGIAIEYDSRKLKDMTNLQEYLSYQVLTDGTTIKDHISQEAYENGVEMLKELGMYNTMLDNYVPGFWISEIESLKLLKIKNISSEGVDWKFSDLADKDGKEIVEIENIEIQAKAITAYTDELADFMLSSGEDTPISEYAAEISKLYDAWAAGDPDKLAELDDISDKLPEELQDDYAAYQKIMLEDRNKNMADAAEDFLKDGKKYFFMVGTLHFAGDEGVDDILAERGYTVERIK